MKDIILLGSTGSVGRSVLDVVRSYPDRFRIKALSGNSNIDLLAEQAEEFSPDVLAIGEESLYPQLKGKLNAGISIFTGTRGIEELVSSVSSDIIFMAISGTSALKPLISALESGRKVALASKEPVVSAGSILRKYLDKDPSAIIPVDSEHSAIMQCLSGRQSRDIKTVYITGSGGSLKDTEKDFFPSLTVEEVLNHPKWDMGRKITVDSATLMNKGLEAIEAHWLFDVPMEKIKIVIHPEAIIHSMVEFLDGTISASLFCPDMRFPVLRALSYPGVLESDLPRIDFETIKNLSFSSPDTDKFPALELAFDALSRGGTVPAVLNSANETAVELFLGGKIKFTDIIRTVKDVTDKHIKINDPSLDEIISSEKWATEEVLRSCLPG